MTRLKKTTKVPLSGMEAKGAEGAEKRAASELRVEGVLVPCGRAGGRKGSRLAVWVQ